MIGFINACNPTAHDYIIMLILKSAYGYIKDGKLYKSHNQAWHSDNRHWEFPTQYGMKGSKIVWLLPLHQLQTEISIQSWIDQFPCINIWL